MEKPMYKSNKDKTLKDVTLEFLRYCKVKNLAEATIFYYTRVLDLFMAYAGEQMHIIEVERDLIFSFILEQREIVRSSSVNNRLRGVRALLYYCMERGYCPQFKIRLVRQEEVIKETFSEDEMILLLKIFSFVDSSSKFDLFS